MARQNYLQNSFTSGELSPLLDAQKNFDKFLSGCKTLQNFLPMPTGGITRRPGTYFMGCVKYAEKKTRLINFQFSVDQTYVIEMGEFYFRFYTHAGQLVQNGAPYEVVHPYTETQLDRVQFIQSGDIIYLAESGIFPQMLARSDTYSWSLNPVPIENGPFQAVNTTATTITPSGTTGLVTLTSSAPLFAATDVGRLINLQTGTTNGTATITAFTDASHVTANVLQALGSGATSLWALGSWSATSGYPRALTFYDDRLFFAGTRSQPQVIWGSASGDYYNFKAGTNDGDALIYPLNSRQVNVIKWLEPAATLVAGSGGGEWVIQSNNFNDQSLTPSNVRARMQTKYGSNESPPVATSNSTIFIQNAGRKVHDFTYSFEKNGFVAPELTLLSEHITGQGIHQPCLQGQPFGIYWAVREDGQLIGLTYLPEQNVSAWHRQVLGGGGQVKSITSVLTAQGDDLWLIVTRTQNGQITQSVERLSPAFIHQDKYDAYFVDSGLSYDGSQTGAATLTPIPNSDAFTLNTTYDLWQASHVGAVIETINGAIEGAGRARITSLIDSQTVIVEVLQPFPSASLIPNSWAIALHKVVGLDHLEGQEIQVLANGSRRGPFVVKQGQVYLKDAAYKIHAGLGYESIMETLDYEAGSRVGSSEGARGRINEIELRFYETLDGAYSIGEPSGDEDLMYFRDIDAKMNASQPLFTGIKMLKANHGYSRQRRIRVVQRDPFPMTLLSILAKVTVSDA